ncbi:MAG TPA: hypothetical protein VMC06_00070 [Opitutaceae bacterium]|nr:hypothetical protein [Opitutaceae bacterium]
MVSPAVGSAPTFVVAGSAVVMGVSPQSVPAFMPNSTVNPSFVAKSGVVFTVVSSAGFQ